MSVTTFEGIVENGQIRLPPGVVLPDHQTVLIVVSDSVPSATYKLPGIRLANKADAAKFEMEVTWEDEQ